LTPHN